MAMSRHRKAQRKQGSNDDNRDLISDLPAPIIHDILSRLPNKASARTCVLSKTWRNLYASRPIMVFSEFDFHPGGSNFTRRDERMRFMDYVEHSLERSFQQKSTPLQKFDLKFGTCKSRIELDFGRINLWLQDVFDNGVKTMTIDISSNLLFENSLPQLVLVSQTLHELYLNGFCLIRACRDINLPNLKVLSLFYVNLIDDLIEQLISGCPLVEVLRLHHCQTLYDLQVSSLSKLVELSLYFCPNVRMVEIGSPVFHSFTYYCGSSSRPIALLGASETLRKLNLNIWSVRTWWLANQLSSFKCLEELILVYVKDFGKITRSRICSQSLTRLVIKSCGGMTEVAEIDCPNLQSMEYECNDMPFHFASALNLRDFRLEVSPPRSQYSIWLDALGNDLFHNSLRVTKNLKIVILLGDRKEVTFVDGLIEVVPYILSQIDSLEYSTPRIIVTSSYIDLANIVPISYPWPSRSAINVVSSRSSRLPQVIWEKILSLQQSRIGSYSHLYCVKKDTSRENIPTELQQHQLSPYQMTRIILKWGRPRKSD